MSELAGRMSTIGGKLRRLSILSSATAIIAATIALLYFQLRDVRANLVTSYSSIADLIAFNVGAAVDFNDADAATRILASLQARPEVAAAGIVVGDQLFARYQRRPGEISTIPPSIRKDAGYEMTSAEMIITRPIRAGERTLGMLFIRSDLHEIQRTRRRFLTIAFVVIIPAVLIAILVCEPLQRTISQPILALAGLAQKVSTTRDYSVRATETPAVAELAQFVGTFNQMLAEIERQHEEIEEAQATLERRVEVRTAELAAANDELESFSYSVSHDLRAPLRAIDGFSQALLANYPAKVLDERGVHYLERVRAGAQRMGALIDDMLHLARVSRHNLKRTDTDVTALAQQIAAELERQHPDRRVLCEIEPGLEAWADAHLLAIAFTNLLSNAWKFTRDQPEARITVSQETTPEGVVFSVRDNGAGFDMAYVDKLFGAFQRLHSNAEFEGTGIGLATVKRIITRHGGHIWAEAAPGKGAAFSFTLGRKS